MVRLASITTEKYISNKIPTDGQMHEAVAALAACGVSPVVRIAANEAWMVKRMVLKAILVLFLSNTV